MIINNIRRRNKDNGEKEWKEIEIKDEENSNYISQEINSMKLWYKICGRKRNK